MPSNQRLESTVAKLRAAHYRLRDLEGQFDADVKADRYGLRCTVDEAAGEVVVHAVFPRDIFVAYSIRIGEVVHQIRSALDHLIWGMTSDPTPISSKRTAFPVAMSESAFENNKATTLGDINDRAAVIIKGLQPFGLNIETEPLYILNELWNRDKHRLLNSGVAFLQGGFENLFIYPDRHVLREFVNTQEEYDDGAEIWRRPFPPDFNREVKIVGEVAMTDIRFRKTDPVSGQSVSDLLTGLLTFVCGVVEVLASTLDDDLPNSI